MPNSDPPPPVRDKYGRYIGKNRLKINGQALKTTTTLATPPVTPIPEFEKPLVSVNVNNPFKKILYWLDQIRRHQTTTMAFKISIPLIAIPIIIAALFTYSRYRVASLNKVNPTPKVQASPKPTSLPTASPSAIAAPKVNRSGTLRIAWATKQPIY